MSALSFHDYYNRDFQNKDQWTEFDQVQIDWILNRLQILFNPDTDFSVLHLGCLDGSTLSQIGSVFPHATLHGVEDNSENIRDAQKNLKSRGFLSVVDLNDYNAQGRYDVILSTCRLHALDSPSDHLDGLHALLNPDGHVFISEILLSSLWQSIQYWRFKMKAKRQYYNWSQNDFRYLLQACDFNIVNGAVLKPDDVWRIQIYHAQGQSFAH